MGDVRRKKPYVTGATAVNAVLCVNLPRLSVVQYEDNRYGRAGPVSLEVFLILQGTGASFTLCRSLRAAHSVYTWNDFPSRLFVVSDV